MSTTYTTWISTGAEVNEYGQYAVFGSVATTDEIDGTRVDLGQTVTLDPEIGEAAIEKALAEQIAQVQAELATIAGTELDWRTPQNVEADGFGGWNVATAQA